MSPADIGAFYPALHSTPGTASRAQPIAISDRPVPDDLWLVNLRRAPPVAIPNPVVVVVPGPSATRYSLGARVDASCGQSCERALMNAARPVIAAAKLANESEGTGSSTSPPFVAVKNHAAS